MTSLESSSILGLSDFLAHEHFTSCVLLLGHETWPAGAPLLRLAVPVLLEHPFGPAALAEHSSLQQDPFPGASSVLGSSGPPTCAQICSQVGPGAALHVAP